MNDDIFGLGIWQDAQKESRRRYGKQNRADFLYNAREILRRLKRERRENIIIDPEEEEDRRPNSRKIQKEVYDILGIEEDIPDAPPLDIPDAPPLDIPDAPPLEEEMSLEEYVKNNKKLRNK